MRREATREMLDKAQKLYTAALQACDSASRGELAMIAEDIRARRAEGDGSPAMRQPGNPYAEMSDDEAYARHAGTLKKIENLLYKGWE